MLLHRLGATVEGFSLPAPVSSPNLFDLAGLSELCVHRRGDILDLAEIRSAVEGAKPSIVIHMAAQPIVRLGFRDPVQTIATNVVGVANVLDACRNVPGIDAVLVVTSDKCYENREQIWPYRENDAMGGHDPYSVSKGCAELVAASFGRTFFNGPNQARVATVRAGNVIGGGDWAADRLLPDLVRAAVSEAVVEIRNPSSVRPWQHVLDPLNGYLLAAERIVTSQVWAGFDCWNFGPTSGEELPVRKVVELFQRIWNGSPTANIGVPQPAEHEAGLLRIDATKAKVELSWRPCTDNEGAVLTTVQWFKAQASGGDARQLAFEDIEKLLCL
jgi:CDP-glucose 4,6-dehydratase